MPMLISALLLSAWVSAAAGSLPPEAVESEPACVRRVLAADDRLGTARNLAPQAMPLEAAVDQYVTAMQRIDMRGCPTAFVEAFSRHRDAWVAITPLFARHADLRGEMHDLFERIREGPDGPALVTLEAAIWSTWDEVERAAQAHADAPP